MSTTLYCHEKALENVNEFKYLGVVISRSNNSPVRILDDRIDKATKAFYSVKCHARKLGLLNRRVRI